jgi:hypothetical protein
MRDVVNLSSEDPTRLLHLIMEHLRNEARVVTDGIDESRRLGIEESVHEEEVGRQSVGMVRRRPPTDLEMLQIWLARQLARQSLVSLPVALSRGQREGWDAPVIQRLFAVAGVALVSFIACELLAKEPLVDLRVYANMTFAAVSGIIVLFFMTFAASTFLLVILMQRLLEYTPAQAGLVLMPGSIVLALSFPLAGRVADRCDRRVIMLCALSAFALSSYLSTFLSLEWPLSWIVWLVVLPRPATSRLSPQLGGDSRPGA